MNAKLHDLLLKHEGLRLFPYTDTVGKLTIGIGRNLSDRGISNSEAEILFENDVRLAELGLKSAFYNYDSFSENRKNALTDMVFNMGLSRFYGFKKMITATRSGDWARAADEMLDSLWANQVGNRATELANMVRNG